MPLVGPKDISKAIGLGKVPLLGKGIGWLVMRVLGLHKANRLYDNNRHLQDVAFLDGLLSDLDVKFSIPVTDLERLPKDGAFITVSNHPLGGLDGILLLKLMVEQREDYKLLANFLLERIEPLSPYIMPVNPFEDRKDIRSSTAGIKQSLQHLKDGHPLGIFPAGEVSTVFEGKRVVDKQWELTAIKFIQKAEVPVVPIYFSARNTRTFYTLARISGLLRTARLPSELFKQRNRVIRVRIGRPIPVASQKRHTEVEQLSQFLRQKTYVLSNSFKKRRSISLSKPFKSLRSEIAIAEAKNHSESIQEIEQLRANGDSLFVSNNYEVFFAKSEQIPAIMHEIGRLREITFRNVGEGSMLALDLDNYDSYYRHLFLWDNNENALAGAYRIGFGQEIYPEHGIKGFYLNQVFKFDPSVHDVLKHTIEMGRAFISSDYQQKPMPLFLLWRGITQIAVTKTDHHYLMGAVSISNKFTDFSKSLMVEFLKEHFLEAQLAQNIKPKKRFRSKLKDKDKRFIFSETSNDLNKLDKLIEEFETTQMRLPVLIKKYLKQNARVLSFNVDVNFNNCIDALMYINIADIPEDTVISSTRKSNI